MFHGDLCLWAPQTHEEIVKHSVVQSHSSEDHWNSGVSTRCSIQRMVSHGVEQRSQERCARQDDHGSLRRQTDPWNGYGRRGCFHLRWCNPRQAHYASGDRFPWPRRWWSSAARPPKPWSMVLSYYSRQVFMPLVDQSLDLRGKDSWASNVGDEIIAEAPLSLV